jgi:hypothetical protein
MNRIICMVACSALAGCVGTSSDLTGEPPAPGAASGAQAPGDSSTPVSLDDTGPLPARDPGDAPGYVHSLAASRFRVGDGPRGLSEAAWFKIVGNEGVFATDPHTGAVRANPNGDAPAVHAPALTTSADVHNARVLAYFRAAGLPMAQVGGAHVTTIMKVEGPAATAGTQRPTFVAYTTIVERTIDGIRVPDSFAWARFNTRDEVVAEGVYWPTIPAAAIAAARGLRDQLADSTRGGAFRSQLGVPEASAQGGLVTIRHSGAVSRGAFDAFAAYDVHVPYGDGMNGRGRTVHFDVNGRARALPVDDPAAPVTRDSPK